MALFWSFILKKKKKKSFIWFSAPWNHLILPPAAARVPPLTCVKVTVDAQEPTGTRQLFTVFN